MKIWVILTLVLCAVFRTSATFSCSVTGGRVPPTGVKFEDVINLITETYSVQYVMNGLNHDPMTVKEYYDFELGRGAGALKIQDNKKRSCYYKGRLQQPVVTDKNSCNGTTLKDCAKIVLLDDIHNFNNKKNYPISPLALWIEASKSTGLVPLYRGVTKVREIDVYKWQFCMFRSVGSMKVTFYTSVKSWNKISGMGFDTTVPVAMDIFGQVNNRNLNRTYNFYGFQRDFHKHVMQVPVGIGCSRMNKPLHTPEIPDSVTFRAMLVDESYYSARQTLKEFEFEFHYFQKVIKISTEESNTWHSYTQDYKTGVAFVEEYDSETDEATDCKIQGLSDDDLPYVFRRHGAATIANPETLFGLKDKIYYLGEGWIDDISVSIFEGVENNYTSLILDEATPKLVRTYYFATDDVKEAVDGEILPDQSLVRIQFTSYSKYGHKDTLIMNVVDYYSDDTLVDVSDCFFDKSKLEMTMLFKENYSYPLLYNNLEEIEVALTDAIASKYSISTLRVAELYISNHRGSIFASFILLDAPPPSVRFSRNGYGYPSKSLVAITVQDVDGCAAKCLESQNLCMGFYLRYMTGHQRCYLSASPEPEKSSTGAVVQYSCSFYTAGSYASHGIPKSLSEVAKEMNTSVQTGALSITIPLMEGNSYVQKKFTVAELDVNGDFDIPKEYLPHSYERISDDYELKEDTAGVDLFSTTTQSRQECLLRCQTTKGCETVSFCTDDHSCRGSTMFIDNVNTTEVKKYINEREECAIFLTPYTHQFIRVSDSSSLLNSDLQIKNAPTEVYCARSCAKNTKFVCHSYQYCNKEKVCSLFKKPFELTFSPGLYDKNLNCISAVRDYMSGFRFMEFKNFTEYTGTLVKDININNCSEQCYNNDECGKIMFCRKGDKNPFGDKSTCILGLNPADEPVQNPQAMTKTECAIMEKKNLRTQPRSDDGGKTGKVISKKKSSGVSGGAMAGICIAMLVVGAVIVVVAFFGMERMKRNRRMDNDISITYSKQDD